MNDKNKKTVSANYTAVCISIMFLVGIVCGFIFEFTNSFPICILISVILGLIIGVVLDKIKKK